MMIIFNGKIERDLMKKAKKEVEDEDDDSNDESYDEESYGSYSDDDANPETTMKGLSQDAKQNDEQEMEETKHPEEKTNDVVLNELEKGVDSDGESDYDLLVSTETH